MAQSVSATIRIVVKAEARIVFIGLEFRRPEPACRRIAQSAEKQNVEESSYGVDEVRKRLSLQRKPDQSSATSIESLGLAASYLMLAGWPATRRSSRIWLSRPVMSCAV